MVSARNVAVLAVALVIGVTLLSPINSAVIDNTGEVDVDEESLTAEIGEWQSLANNNLVEDSETVEYYDDGTDEWVTATEGTDYEINYDDGEVQFLEGGAVSEGDDVRVSYTYEATDSMTTTVLNLIPLFVALFLLVALARPLMNGL